MATKVYIVYYSMYGHVAKLAEEIQKGAASVDGVEAKLWQVPETLPDEVLGKMGAPPKSDAPIITPNELADADGLLLGFPTRFGMMAYQLLQALRTKKQLPGQTPLFEQLRTSSFDLLNSSPIVKKIECDVLL